MGRIVATALAEQLSGWVRAEQMAECAGRERFLDALEKFQPPNLHWRTAYMAGL
jgi:hypothetical protein